MISTKLSIETKLYCECFHGIFPNVFRKRFSQNTFEVTRQIHEGVYLIGCIKNSFDEAIYFKLVAVLKMLLQKRAKAQLIWNKWLSRRIVLCNLWGVFSVIYVTMNSSILLSCNKTISYKHPFHIPFNFYFFKLFNM